LSDESGNDSHKFRWYVLLPLRIQRLIAESFRTVYGEQSFADEPLLTTGLLLTLLRVIKKI